jgi:hypothetical protein
MEIYTTTLHGNITTDVKKKKGGGKISRSPFFQVAPKKLAFKLQEEPSTKHCSQNHETSISPLDQTRLIDEALFPETNQHPFSSGTA